MPKVVLYRDKLGNCLVYNDNGSEKPNSRYSLDLETSDGEPISTKEVGVLGMWLNPDNEAFRLVQALAAAKEKGASKQEINSKASDLLKWLVNNRGVSGTAIVKKTIELLSQNDDRDTAKSIASPILPTAEKASETARATKTEEDESDAPLDESKSVAREARAAVSDEHREADTQVLTTLEAIVQMLKELLGLEAVSDNKSSVSAVSRHSFSSNIAQQVGDQPPAEEPLSEAVEEAEGQKEQVVVETAGLS